MTEIATMRKIRAAAEKRARADRTKQEATDQLQKYCHEARRIGVPVAQIALETGLSRQGIYDLLSRKKP